MPMSPRYDHETIRRYVAAGLTAKQIAERIGCSKGVVWKIMREIASTSGVVT